MAFDAQPVRPPRPPAVAEVSVPTVTTEGRRVQLICPRCSGSSAGLRLRSVPLRALPPPSLDQWLHTPPGSLDPLSLQLYSPTEERERERVRLSLHPPPPPPPSSSDPLHQSSPADEADLREGSVDFTHPPSVDGAAARGSDGLFTCSYRNLLSRVNGGN